MAVFEVVVKKDGEEIKKMTGHAYLATITKTDDVNIGASLFVRGDSDVTALLGACVSIGTQTMLKGAELNGLGETEIQEKYEKLWKEILRIADTSDMEIGFVCNEKGEEN